MDPLEHTLEYICALSLMQSARTGIPSEHVWSLLAAVEPGLQALATRGGEYAESLSEYLKGRRHPGGDILISDFPPEQMLQLLKVGD